MLGLGHAGGKYTYVQLQSFDPVRLAQITPLPPSNSGLAPGLYVHVLDGVINVTNKGGSTTFSAGQFGYTPNPTQPPIVVPKNPGLQFTPPPAFSAPPTSQGGNAAPKSNAVDCVVR